MGGRAPQCAGARVSLGGCEGEQAAEAEQADAREAVDGAQHSVADEAAQRATRRR